MPTTPPTTQAQARAQFPALKSNFAYLENAGGSQVPLTVADAVRDHMLTDYVQLGAGYPQADRATKLVADAHSFMELFVNAGSLGKVVLGQSTTSLINLIASAYGDILNPGDEVIIAESNHEANAGAWERLSARGAVVKNWTLNHDSFRCEPKDLESLISQRTKLVALPHVSNILGQVEDVQKVCRIAHSVGAKVCVDGVAFAPHSAVDAANLGTDWYVFSAYKVYGPHLGVLFGTHEAFSELTGPNHSFIPKDAVPAKWELGGVSHEACAGLLGLKSYFEFLAGEPLTSFPQLQRAYQTMADWEAPCERRLRDYLRNKPDVKIIGPSEKRNDTVGTVSFVHNKLSSDRISAHVNSRDIGIRHGNMYAVRLVRALGIDLDTGVVRVSMVHTNTVEESERLITVLEEIL